MNDQNVPSLSLIVDQITVRIEWAEQQGLTRESHALHQARECITDHVFEREVRQVSILAQILERLHIRPAA